VRCKSCFEDGHVFRLNTVFFLDQTIKNQFGIQEKIILAYPGSYIYTPISHLPAPTSAIAVNGSKIAYLHLETPKDRGLRRDDKPAQISMFPAAVYRKARSRAHRLCYQGARVNGLCGVSDGEAVVGWMWGPRGDHSSSKPAKAITTPQIGRLTAFAPPSRRRPTAFATLGQLR
jgi:hypothetical protein